MSSATDTRRVELSAATTVIRDVLNRTHIRVIGNTKLVTTDEMLQSMSLAERERIAEKKRQKRELKIRYRKTDRCKR